jgi:4a-hydroxytetrahydrobiopterin dehydratase
MAKRKKVAGKAKRPGKLDIEVPAGWHVDKGGKSMSIALVTEDFLEAVNLINAIAPIAEQLEHHPDFHLEKWNQLRVTTYSHDVGKLTERDEKLARGINEVLEKRKGK